MHIHHDALGVFYSAAFLSAMVQEGGRVEAENNIAVDLHDWIFTYLNF
jgi:putative ubiquitin-RnfH superfamily antitoxin RatB of RatAB toxin-antitoxin module